MSFSWLDVGCFIGRPLFYIYPFVRLFGQADAGLKSIVGNEFHRRYHLEVGIEEAGVFSQGILRGGVPVAIAYRLRQSLIAFGDQEGLLPFQAEQILSLCDGDGGGLVGIYEVKGKKGRTRTL
jgi:hypothetical protein